MDENDSAIGRLRKARMTPPDRTPEEIVIVAYYATDPHVENPAQAIIAALASHGYVIVPREPTEEMAAAGCEEPVDHSWGAVNKKRHPTYPSPNAEFICDASGIWDAMIRASQEGGER